MCEFKVFLEGKEVFQDVVYVRMEGKTLILRDVMGVTRSIPNSKIVEIDVASEKLVVERG
jgi:predicted RNA-binding protein